MDVNQNYLIKDLCNIDFSHAKIEFREFKWLLILVTTKVFNLPIHFAPEIVEVGLLSLSNYLTTNELVEISKVENQWNYTSLTSIDVYFSRSLTFLIKKPYFLNPQTCKLLTQIETLSLIFWMNPNRIIKKRESEGRLNKPGTITGNYKQDKACHQNFLCIITRVNDIITMIFNVNSTTFIFHQAVDSISVDQCS